MSEAADIGLYSSYLPEKILHFARGVDGAFMLIYHFFKVKKKGDCHQHELVSAAALVLAYRILMGMP